MRVKCVKLINEITGKMEKTSPWLTIGKTYMVLEVIFSDYDGTLSYRLISDDAGSPVLNHADLFEVVSGYIPSTWVVNAKAGRYFSMLPERWAQTGVLEAYFDAEPWAIAIYKEEVAKMQAEEEAHLAKIATT